MNTRFLFAFGLSFLFLASSTLRGQVLSTLNYGPCTFAISNQQFQQLRNPISAQPNPQQRLSVCLQSLQNVCLNAQQLMDLMRIFNSDEERLQVAYAGVPRLVPNSDVYPILDMFSRFSTAIHFYEFMLPRLGGQTLLPPGILQPVPVPVQPVQPIPAVPVFPMLNYPGLQGYAGPRNCGFFLSDADFDTYAQQIFNQQGEVTRSRSLNDLAGTTCLSTAQAMKFSTLLEVENNRLEFLRRAYARIFDEANFDQAQQVFSHPPNKLALADFIRQARQAQMPVTPQPPPCVVAPEQFRMLREALAREGSSNSRLKIARDQIPPMRCFTSQQMKEVLGLFSSSVDRLDLAKFAYAYVSDQENYYLTVNSLFNSSLDREELSKFIASRPR